MSPKLKVFIGFCILVILTEATVFTYLAVNNESRFKQTGDVTDYDYISPAQMFPENSVMTGLTVVPLINKFEKQKLIITVKTKVAENTYNYDGVKAIPTYTEKDLNVNDANYINPHGMFLCSFEYDEDGKVVKVSLTQQ